MAAPSRWTPPAAPMSAGSTNSSNFPGASFERDSADQRRRVSTTVSSRGSCAGGALVYSTYLGGTPTTRSTAWRSTRPATPMSSATPTPPTSRSALVRLQPSQERAGQRCVRRPGERRRQRPGLQHVSGRQRQRDRSTTWPSTATAVPLSPGGPPRATSPRPSPFQRRNRGSGDAFVSALNAPAASLIVQQLSGQQRRAASSASASRSTPPATPTSRARPIPRNFSDRVAAAAEPGRIGRRRLPGEDSRRARRARAATNLVATAIVGNTVTIAWTAPANSLPTHGLRPRGGITLGSVLASLPTNSAATTYTFSAPTGAYYIRMHSTAAG